MWVSPGNKNEKKVLPINYFNFKIKIPIDKSSV